MIQFSFNLQSMSKEKMQKAIINYIKKYKLQLLIIAVFLMCYLVFVYAQRHFFTYDTVVSQIRWWNYMLEHGWHGGTTMNDSGVGDYTTIWYFMIAIFTELNLYPRFPIEYSIKFMAITCSLLSAGAVFMIAKYFRPRSQYLPVIVACITPFLPMFSMDLLKTNLTDGMYIMPCLWSFYFFLINKKELSWFLLALGACFKLMAIYLVPVYAFFYLKDFTKYSLREKLAPLWGALAVLICSIPNMAAGGKFLDGIVTPIIGRNDDVVVMPWFWLIPTGNNFTSPDIAREMRTMLYGLLILIFFMTIFFILKYVKKEKQRLVGLAILPTLSIMVCFYLMPSQHETYFAMAGIFALIGFIIQPKKELFINFFSVNLFLFFMYLFGLTWWYEEPVWVLPNIQMGLVYLGLIIFNYYLLYQCSIFYRPSKISKTL